MTRIEGHEGCLIDTGSFKSVGGKGPIMRQVELAAQAGHATKWELLPKPRYISGVGDNSKVCRYRAHIPGILDHGERMRTAPQVIDDEKCEVPHLYGLEDMEFRNIFFGTRNGVMASVPNGKEDEIVWPKGTTFTQCRKAKSGHWIMVTSNWDQYRPKNPTAKTAVTHKKCMTSDGQRHPFSQSRI